MKVIKFILKSLLAGAASIGPLELFSNYIYELPQFVIGWVGCLMFYYLINNVSTSVNDETI